jgi:hypothetical protein
MQHPGWTLVVIGAFIAGMGLVWLLAPSLPWLDGQRHFISKPRVLPCRCAYERQGASAANWNCYATRARIFSVFVVCVASRQVRGR